MKGDVISDFPIYLMGPAAVTLELRRWMGEDLGWDEQTMIFRN